MLDKEVWISFIWTSVAQPKVHNKHHKHVRNGGHFILKKRMYLYFIFQQRIKFIGSINRLYYYKPTEIRNDNVKLQLLSSPEENK